MDYKEKQYLKLDDNDSFFDSESVVSTTECTGLMYSPPASVDEAESYNQIYDVPYSKDKINNNLQHE
jgi:hypothetical protein